MKEPIVVARSLQQRILFEMTSLASVFEPVDPLTRISLLTDYKICPPHGSTHNWAFSSRQCPGEPSIGHQEGDLVSPRPFQGMYILKEDIV